VVDRQDAFRKNRMKGMFTWLLYEKMQQTLANGEQIILFQNRRGFSSQVECPDCGYVPKCRHCDVSLTYHKSKNRLQCHYCGYSIPVPTQCPTCGGSPLKDKGFGTEKVIEALSQYFPGVSAERLDVDATHNGQVYRDIIERFATGKTQILVGTQMVAKGLDFDNVGLVGILNADNMMSFPDFRSAERAYQLMVQVSGRAGRRAKQGLVVLQTSQTEHYLMPAVLNQQYEEFYQKELQERYDFLYPPFVKMIAIQVRHVRADVAAKVANVLANTLRKQWQDAVLGPTDAAVSKQHNKYVKQLLIKIKASSQQVRENVFLEVERIKKEYSSVDIVVDVDPI
jgi:primosomal protein N' (replication factor Y)